jgi:hypothetical protein
MLPARQAEMVHDEANEVHVIDRVGFVGRHVRAVAVRTHGREHDPVRLQGWPVLGFKGAGDARNDGHEKSELVV